MDQPQALAYILASKGIEVTPSQAEKIAQGLARRRGWCVDDAYEFLFDLNMPANDESENN